MTDILNQEIAELRAEREALKLQLQEAKEAKDTLKTEMNQIIDDLERRLPLCLVCATDVPDRMNLVAPLEMNGISCKSPSLILFFTSTWCAKQFKPKLFSSISFFANSTISCPFLRQCLNVGHEKWMS